MGYIRHAIWTRVTLWNESPKKQARILINPHGGMDKIQVIMVFSTEGTINKVEQQNLGLHYSLKEQTIADRRSNLYIELLPNQQVTIYSRLSNIGPTQVDWQIYDLKSYSKLITYETIFWGIFAGLIVFFIFYNLTVYALKPVAIWPYVVFALIALIYQYASKGIFRFAPFHVSIETLNLIVWAAPYLILASLNLFTLFLFNTKHHFPRWHKLLWFSIAIYIFFTITLFISFEIGVNLIISNLWVIYLGIFIPVIVGVYMLSQRIPGSGYYVTGQTFLFLGHLAQVMILNGQLPNNAFTSFSIPVAILIDLFFLSLAYAKKMAQTQKENEKLKALIVNQSRFNTIGQAFGDISHEWRSKLIRFGSYLTELEAKLSQQKPERLEENINKVSQNMMQQLDELNLTVTDFQRFFSQDPKPIDFDAVQCCHDVLDLLKSKQAWSMTEIQVIAPNAVTIHSYPNTFAQILILLLDIAIQPAHPKTVKIQFNQETNWLSISISNNIENTIKLEDRNRIEVNLTTAKILLGEKLQGQLLHAQLTRPVHIRFKLACKLIGE
jgi:signal transduction histidine kinase